MGEKFERKGKRRNGSALTPLQGGMLKGILAGNSDAMAYKDAGGTGKSKSSPRDVKRAILLKVPEIMERLGLSDKTLLRECLIPALEATETKFFQKDGAVTDRREVPNWEARLKALDIAFRLLGSYAARPGTRVEIPGDGDIEVHIHDVK